MSAVVILTPLVIAAWPAFSSAVVAAAASLGYMVVEEQKRKTAEEVRPAKVNLEIPNSQVVTGQLERDKSLAVTKDGVTVTFKRDARGKGSLCVTGEGKTEEELRQLGQQLGQRVVQQYVYDRIMAEVKAKDFVVVEQETDENNCIRLKVRHWES